MHAGLQIRPRYLGMNITADYISMVMEAADDM